jgi:hypothetical protein
VAGWLQLRARLHVKVACNRFTIVGLRQCSVDFISVLGPLRRSCECGCASESRAIAFFHCRFPALEFDCIPPAGLRQ